MTTTPVPGKSGRPSMDDIYMDMARSLAKRSTCDRLQVGTVIATMDRRQVLSVGYNGNAAGLPNCCDRSEAGNCGCLHSEENATIACCAPRDQPKIVFVTHSPCPMCAKRLINLGGVSVVIYDEEYRDPAGLRIFEEEGIRAYKYERKA